MRKTALQHLDNIMEAIGSIEEHAAGISFAEFSRDPKKKAIVLRNFRLSVNRSKIFLLVSGHGTRIPTGTGSPDSQISLLKLIRVSSRLSGTISVPRYRT